MWPAPDQTQELLHEAREGSQEAIDQLLTRHRESVRRLIQLRLDHAIARRVDASDIVQEVMLEASRRLDEYLKDPPMPFHLWLRHLAKDHMIDAHRRHRAAKRNVEREQAAQPPAWGDQSSYDLIASLACPELTPASAAIRKELERRFNDALTEMHEDDREIILMRHFEQLSNQEAAMALGLSEPAASMRYLRALRRLRSYLQPGSESQA